MHSLHRLQPHVPGGHIRRLHHVGEGGIIPQSPRKQIQTELRLRAKTHAKYVFFPAVRGDLQPKISHGVDVDVGGGKQKSTEVR